MKSTKVLLLDDQIGDLAWLLDLLEDRGYEVFYATNEKDARSSLEAIARGEMAYALAVVDVMMAVDDISRVVELDDAFFQSSKDTGVRLCRYARRELGISAEELPMIAFSQRDDEEVKRALAEAGVEYRYRAAADAAASLRHWIERHLPDLS